MKQLIRMFTQNQSLQTLKISYINIKDNQLRVEKKDPAVLAGWKQHKVTEILIKENKQYKFPGCKLRFKPQGITNHVKSCVGEGELTTTQN